MAAFVRSAVLVLVALVSVSAPARAVGPSRVEALGWMAGCWEGGDASSRLVEQWTKPDGGTMLGVGRVVAGEKTVFYEYMRLWQDEKGDVFYSALLPGQAEVPFRLVMSSTNEAVFENPAHDFPQRISYRLQPDGSLFARVEAIAAGGPPAEEFVMRRGRCEAR